MPGTIEIVVGMMDLPKTEANSEDTFRFKVSMGKREYRSVGEEACSIPVASLRENLLIEIHDTNGTKIIQTEFKTITVVEKGVLEDSYPLNSGGYIKMKLQFSLSQEELLRIREMRERALKRKREEQPKTGTMNSDFGNRIGNQVALFNLKEARPGQLRHSDPLKDVHILDSSKASTSMASTTPEISTTLQIYQRPSDLLFKGDNVHLTKSNQEYTRHQLPLMIMNKSHKSEFSNSSPSRNSTQHSFSNASELKKIESSVKKMVSAFESSQHLGPNPCFGSRFKTSQSKIGGGIDGYLKRVVPYEESDIVKPEVPPRISKSFSSGMLSDIIAQPKQAAFENVGAVKSLQMVNDHSKTVDEPKFKNQEPEDFEETTCTTLPIAEPVIERDGHVMLLSQSMKEQDENINLDMDSKKNTDYNESSSRNIPSDNNETVYLQVSENIKSVEECTSPTETHISMGIIDKYEIIERTDSISAKQTDEYKFCGSQENKEVACTNTNEATGLVRDCVFNGYSYENQDVWTTQDICITTASKQVRDFIDHCKNRGANNSSEVNSASYQEKKLHDDGSLEDKKDANSSGTCQNKTHVNSTSTSNIYGGFLEQGVKIVVAAVALAALFFSTRPQKQKKNGRYL